jgi:Tol biopolymer transport system component
MSDPISSSTLAFDALHALAYLNVGIAAAFAAVLVIALVCCVFELRGGRREGRQPARSWRLAVAMLLVAWPAGLHAQTRRDIRSAERVSPTITLDQDTARTVTRRVWADADLHALSPDGRLAAFTDWSMQGSLAVRDLETGAVRRLTVRGDSGDAEESVFSRDGKWLAYSWYDEAQPAYYKLGIVDIEGTEPRIIYRDRTTTWIDPEDWSPDGRYILAYRTVRDRDAGEIVLISVVDGSARLLKSLPNPSPGRGGGMTFSPDGRYVAYHYWRDNPENSDVFVLNVSTGEEHVLIEDPADDRMLGWAPEGKHVLFQSDRSGTPGAWLLPVADGKADGTPWLVKPDMWRTSGVGFTRDGRYFYRVTTQRRDVYVAAFDPESRSVVGSPTAISAHALSSASGAHWSPDGRHLAYSRERDEASPVDKIVAQSMETGDVKEFDLGVPGWVRVHSWTAEGRALVIVVSNPGDQDNRVALYRLDVQTGRKELLPNPRGGVPLAYPLPTPKNGFLLYLLSEENPEGQAAFRFVRHELQTGDSTLLFQTPFGAWGQIMGASLSPDGRTIAFGYAPVTGGPQGKSLVLLPVSGEAPRELPIAGVIRPAWMPDGRALLFQRFAAIGPAWESWYVDLADGEPHSIGLTTYGPVVGLTIDPQGRRIAYTSGKGGTELWVMENFLPAGGRR